MFLYDENGKKLQESFTSEIMYVVWAWVRACGCMDVYSCGSVGWMCGCVGCVDVWVYGYIGVWVWYMGVWAYG